MKKIFFSIVALAALAACSKSEVAYEAPKEIGFTPVKGNVTKATGLSGELATTQKLGVWAYWDKTVEVGDNGNVTEPAYNNYTDNYLVNALFQNKTVNSVSAWGGAGNGYPWPVNGALVFAGYTTPTDAVIAIDDNNAETTGAEVSYTLTDDKMIFTNYSNDDEFDLCWFGRTDDAYNYRANGTSIPVKLNHALTWVTIAAYGQNSAIGWKITSMTLNKYNVAGTATCDGSTKKATWNPVAVNDAESPLTIGASKLPHTLDAATDGKGVELSDNVLIPSKDVELTVNFTFDVNGVPKEDSKTFVLNTTTWESGVHYTYTLVFNSTEILLTPSYEDWATGGNDITVQ